FFRYSTYLLAFSHSLGRKQPFASHRYRSGLGEICLGQRPQSGGLSEFEHLNKILITDIPSAMRRVCHFTQDKCTTIRVCLKCRLVI
uniref:hypothetical protein n=2 Tax=Pseudomonas TaxID=286 RepID=UPI0028989C8B